MIIQWHTIRIMPNNEFKKKMNWQKRMEKAAAAPPPATIITTTKTSPN